MNDIVIAFDTDPEERRALVLHLVRAHRMVMGAGDDAGMTTLLRSFPGALAPVVVAPQRDVVRLLPYLRAQRRRGLAPPPLVLVIDQGEPELLATVLTGLTVVGRLSRPVSRHGLNTLVEHAERLRWTRCDQDPTPPLGAVEVA